MEFRLSEMDFRLFQLCLVVLTLLHVGTLTATTAASTAFVGNETDHLALLAFKSKIIHDPYGLGMSWNNSLHFCEWQGVTCGHRHRRRVTSIDLDSRGLVGSLSPYVGNLSFLRRLNLQNNTFQGKIPTELGNLFRVQSIMLSNNSFEGEIPTNLSRCSNLTFLGVAYNKLVGKFPKELTSLSKLTFLVIHVNNLTGGIPPFIGNLTSLETISAGKNNFGGSIPDTLGQLKKLRQLGFGGNQLSEYGLGSEISTYGDVYSYGILLLEIITGKRPTDNMLEEGLNLHSFARMALPDHVMEIVDPVLLDNEKEEARATTTAANDTWEPIQVNNGSRMEECLISMVNIGVACSTKSPQGRMSISNILHELHLVKNKLLQDELSKSAQN